MASSLGFLFVLVALEDEFDDEQHDVYGDQDPIDDDIVDQDEMGDFIVRDGREAEAHRYSNYGISGGQNDRAMQVGTFAQSLKCSCLNQSRKHLIAHSYSRVLEGVVCQLVVVGIR